MFTKSDIEILRPLAKRVKEIAELPEMEEKRELWRKHTSLQGKRPPVFVSPEGSWAEILPDSSILCEGAAARNLERELRMRLFRYDVIKDDTPIENRIDIPRGSVSLWDLDWGVKPQYRRSEDNRGAWHHVPVIEDPSDWKKLKLPKLPVFEDADARAEEIREALGDLLDIRVTGIKIFDFHIAHMYCDFRGLENLMYDLMDEPEMVEEAYSLFEEGLAGIVREARKLHLVDLNNDHTYHYTGGLGYTYDLPKREVTVPDLCDLWGAAEAQEYSCISPEMFAETIFPHERRLLEHFGLNGYGCCDDLTEKLDTVLTIKNLRRVAACPWANLERMADRLKKDYILTWKPNPAHLAPETFREEEVEKYMTESLRQAKAGYPEIILRDTHSCHNDPERFARFVRLTRRAINTVYGEE